MDQPSPAAPPTSPPGPDPVGDDLAAALQAAGAGGEGARALGLLRDAHRILSDPAAYDRPAEIAESCVRSAVESLLKLGERKKEKPPGLASAARALLKAVNAYRPPGAAPARRGYDPGAAWQHVNAAADRLRLQLDNPGGYHDRRAAGIVEHRTGRIPGLAQKNALQVWSDLYSGTSATLHGADSDPQAAADRYRAALKAIGDVFLPLIARRDAVLDLLRRTDPDADDAKALASLSDPRALAYFFQHRPAPGWIDVLDENLLMPDPAAAGAWPAFPYLDDLAATRPARARRWLTGRAGAITAAGPLARAQLLRLAARPGIDLAAQVRALTAAQFKPGHRPDDAVPALAAQWARTVPPAERGTDWVRTVETLLAAAIDAAHDRSDARLAALIRLAEADSAGDGADAAPAFPADAAGPSLAGREAAGLMAALAATAAHLAATGPHPPAGAEYTLVALLRTVTAVLLVRDLKRTDRTLTGMLYADIDPGVATTPGTDLGPRLARTVLDIAAHEAAAGTPWAERTAEIAGRVAAADARLADRLLADHLTTTAGAAGAGEAGQWWERALALTGRLPGTPDAQSARLVAHAAAHCPPRHTGRLHAALRALLGPAPTARDLGGHLAARAADPALRWPEAWLRVWDWSPVLPQALLAPWTDVLAALRTHEPAGPRDPRDPRSPFAWTPSRPPAVPADLLDPDDGSEPCVAAAAARLAAAPDAHDPRYAAALRTAVDRHPAPWAQDIGATAHALAHPALQAAYLAALAARAERRAPLPAGALAAGARTALDLHRALPAGPARPADPDGPGDRAAALAADALFTLLSSAWRTDADLGNALTADALAHLTRLSAPLIDPAVPDDTDPSRLPTTACVRALQALLEHAAHHARTTTPPALPAALRPLLEAVLDARPADARTAQALAPHLPLLHHHASDLLEGRRAHLLDPAPDRPTPSAAALWLRWGHPYPPLLAALDRTRLLAALHTQAPPQSAEHLAHALLTDPDILGGPHTLLAQLAAAGPDPATAATTLLRATARLTGDDPAVQARAAALWRAALDADLPEGALAGAGAFADTPVDHGTWLTLTLASARHTPRLDDPDLIAERAAGHPRDCDALRLAAHLVAHPAEAWQDHHVRDQARRLLAGADTADPAAGTEVEAVRQLREALVDAGDLAA
ncbi:hypothetical protein [Kitasatospora sp. NPDC088783]|uniref:hypothetical protein n=1 Tax=Kitasatospora sp. NPDC088783 TaxID=3364077 RepID=UPI00381BAE1A